MKKYLKVIYLDCDNKKHESILPFEDGEYLENVSYKENIQDAVSSMMEQGGCWISSRVIIPFHRILAFESWGNNDNDNDNNKNVNSEQVKQVDQRHAKRKRKRKRHQKTNGLSGGLTPDQKNVPS